MIVPAMRCMVRMILLLIVDIDDAAQFVALSDGGALGYFTRLGVVDINGWQFVLRIGSDEYLTAQYKGAL